MARAASIEPLPDRAPRRERADAARNRERVLAAAENLFRSRNPLTVTMEDVARAAGAQPRERRVIATRGWRRQRPQQWSPAIADHPGVIVRSAAAWRSDPARQ
jgi:hypothetical protein